MTSLMAGVILDLRSELAAVAVHAACCARAELATLLSMSTRAKRAAREARPPAGTPEARPPVRVWLPGPLVARRAFALSRGLLSPGGPSPLHLAGGAHRRILVDVAEAALAGSLRIDAPPAAAGAAFGAIVNGLAGRRCCLVAHLRALMVCTAHLSNPRLSSHLEIPLPLGYPARRLAALALRHGLPLLVCTRRGRPLAYLKGRDRIAQLLGQAGAMGTMLALEEVSVDRRMREGINRTVNCEVSNLRRTTGAAGAQLAAIRYLETYRLLDAAPEALREVAALRKAHPDLDLASLALRTGGSLSRSGLYHRLRALVALARCRRAQRDPRSSSRV